MIKIFTFLYGKRLLRLASEIGLLRILVVLVISIVAILSLAEKVRESAPVITCLLFVFVFGIHLQRSDKAFINALHIKEKWLYLCHYHLLVVPYYLLLGAYAKFWLLLALVGGISIIPFASFSISFSESERKLFPTVPFHNFEFRSGMRKQGLVLIMMYILAIVFYKIPYVAFGGIVVFTFLSTTFYNESESREMLEVFRFNPARFLNMKIKNQLQDFWLLALPFLLVFLVMKFEFWYILLVCIVICSIIQALSICLKYTFYEPHIGFDNSIFMAIYFLSLFIPFFVPVPIVMLFKYHRRAKENLNLYLYDYH